MRHLSRAEVPWAAGNVGAVVLVALCIELTGGLPSQLVHLYYIPVVVSALVTSARLSLIVAILAGVAVSPLPDVAHHALGIEPYFADPAPWNLSPQGWVVRPIAFLVINMLAVRMVREQAERIAASGLSASRGEELGVLAHIDQMILNGASEGASVLQLARIVALHMGAKIGAVVMPAADHARSQAFVGSVPGAAQSEIAEADIPLDEGVSGEVLRTGASSTCRDVLADTRYRKMADIAREVGYVSAAAAPMKVGGETIGALFVGFAEERDFSDDEMATLQRLAAQGAIAIAHARQRVHLEELAHRTAVALAGAIESRDPYTGQHCARLAGYAAAVAERMGLPADEVDAIRLGAALHDIGKISVPDAILLKPGPLSREEYDIIKNHCMTGAEICLSISVDPRLNDIVKHHHERFDGNGYPHGLRGDEISIGARIVAAADSYDAMTTDRVYRSAMAREEAAATLRDGAGTQWDPDVVDALLAVLEPAELERAA